MKFPVSITGILVEGGGVVLLENERGEWELPGGRVESQEAPETCLMSSLKNWVPWWKSPVLSTASFTRFCPNARSSS